MTTKKWFCLCLSLLLMFSACAIAEDVTPVDMTGYLSSLSALDLTQYKGKVIMLTFFTEDSDLCLQQLPDLKLLFDDFDPAGVEIVLIHTKQSESAGDCTQLVESLGLTEMNLFEDENATLTTALGIAEFPTTLLIDQQGCPVSGSSGKISYATLAQALLDLNVTQLQNSKEAE